MQREFLKTGDGSLTIRLPQWNEQYHSHHGAITEARHVFIESGLFAFSDRQPPQAVRILEIGFGTGLNVLMSILAARDRNLRLHYHSLEAYPVKESEWKQLNFHELLGCSEALFHSLHRAPWEVESEVDPQICLLKEQVMLEDFDPKDAYDLIYFDAFGPRVQPELWSKEVFAMLYRATSPKGKLVTYSAKGDVRRAMQAAGYQVERLPGPPGKREMLRATRV